MTGWIRYAVFAVLGLLAIVLFTGCGDERRKVEVRHETHESELQDAPQGEMIVE